MNLLQSIVIAVALLRFAELLLSHRNRRRLLAQGGHEVGAGHYPFIVLLHVAWLAALFFTIPGAAAPNWGLLAVFLILQFLRLWIIASLGPYWTTRIITVPGVPLSRRGPYRWMRHPNYAVVVAEIAVLPLAFGAWQVALGFSAANAILLGWRMTIENRVLDERASPGISH